MRGSEHEGLGDGQALLHAAGKGGRQLVLDAFEADGGQHAGRPIEGLPTGLAEEAAGERGHLQLEAEQHVLDARQMREDGVALEDDAAIGAGLGRQRLAVEGDRPAGRLLGAQQQAKEGALAAARGTHHGDEGALGHGQIDVLQDRLAVVALPEMLDGDRVGRAHRLSDQAK